ncbi:MAG TPA: MMPL family transporter [Candidatus Saccharimonadales bacterium]|nr:MMPL family transporter [Candidatus Saccharimonadales bacterium]
MFEKIARFSVKFRWLIIIFWIAVIPLAIQNFPKISDVEKNDVSDFLPAKVQTNKASKLEKAFERKNTATSTDLVVYRDNERLTGQDAAAVSRLSGNIQKVADVTEVRNLGISADGQAQQLLVGITGAGFGEQITQIIDNIRTAMKSTPLPAGLHANMAGELAASVDQQNANQSGQNKTEIYTVILILVLLLLVFRSVLAPIVTLVPAGLALLLSQPVIAEATKIGVKVGFITQILLIVLILGAGTDYGLFLVFRTREELRAGHSPKEAVVRALSRVGEAITFSALTVIAALLTLLLASFGLYQGLGPALAIGLAIMLLMGLTFLPAVLSILGRAVFWPSKTHKREVKFGLWGRMADGAIKHAKLVLVLGVVVFGILSAGLIGYKSAGFGNQPPPSGSDSARGQAALAKHFPAANSNPDVLLLHFDTPIWNDLTRLQTAQTKLSGSEVFAAVSGPLNLNGAHLTTEQLAQIHQGDNLPAQQALGQFISPDGKTIQFYALMKAGPTGSATAMRATPAARAELAAVARAVGADDNGVLGTDSVAYDINQVQNSDLKKIIPVVLVLIGVLLAVMLRSLVAPWYLIATVGLSYVASLGFAMYIFVHFLNQDGLNFVLPFLLFIFGMALGQDYNILVMGRIREEAHHEKTLFAAVTKAIGITGTTVTSAGLILAGTFSILGLVGGNTQVEQIGFGVAFAILLDTFFVRTLLVPSIVALLGKWNWWPSKLSK